MITHNEVISILTYILNHNMTYQNDIGSHKVELCLRYGEVFDLINIFFMAKGIDPLTYEEEESVPKSKVVPSVEKEESTDIFLDDVLRAVRRILVSR